MYVKEHPVFTPPHPNAIVWRYMNLAKFVAILEKNSLFFCRGDKLDDPFEGHVGEFNRNIRRIAYGEIPNLMALHEEADITHRRQCAVNCWHINEQESAAMWKLYASDHDGVAIKTVFSDFAASITDSDDVYAGTVNYVDYDVAFIPEDNAFRRFLHKRNSFEHEQEFRAIILDVELHQKDRPGKYCEVDLNRLVGEVVVSSVAPVWFVDLVQSVVLKYGLETSVRQSNLLQPPSLEVRSC